MRTSLLARLARAGAAVVLVVLGGTLAASLGHEVVMRAERSLNATAATATAVASAARGASSGPDAASTSAATSAASSPAGDMSAAASSASSASRSAGPSASSPSGLTAARMSRLSAQIGAVATRYAAVAPQADVEQFCMAEFTGGTVQANLRATVRAQLSASDQAATDAQLDTLLDAASHAIC